MSERLDIRRDNLLRLLRASVDLYESKTCRHEDRHRGGFLWTICDDCGRQWADDEGGFKPYEEPSEITEVYAIFAELSKTAREP